MYMHVMYVAASNQEYVCGLPVLHRPAVGHVEPCEECVAVHASPLHTIHTSQGKQTLLLLHLASTPKW